MKDERLIPYLARTDLQSRPGKECLDNYRLAATNAGSEISRSEQAHIADCRYCLERIGDLSRIQSDDRPEPLNDVLKKRAVRLHKPGLLPQSAPRWAAAAVLVMAVGFTIERLQQPQPVAKGLPKASESRPVRNVEPPFLQPEVLLPPEGGVLSSSALQFEWTATPGTLYYNVRLVTQDGDLMHQARVTETRLQVPSDVHLTEGEEYFVRVDAYLAEGRRVSSKHVLFTPGKAD